MANLLYLFEKKIWWQQPERTVAVSCQAIEQYRANLMQIYRKKEWKTQGTGARFMGVEQEEQMWEQEHIAPTAMVLVDHDTLIYSAALGSGCAIYKKTLSSSFEEGLILRQPNYHIHAMALDAYHNRLILSVSYPHEREQHLAVVGIDCADHYEITEGGSIDNNPFIDPKQPDLLYYDSHGMAYDESEYMVDLMSREICCLNFATGEVETVVANPDFHFSKPSIDQNGHLYFLQRPSSKDKEPKEKKNTFKDLILAPAKITAAIVGWLDFFTQRYAGQSLKTSTGGRNPAKKVNKSEEDLFIEGNLIQVKETLERNKQLGLANPGIVPTDWQLMKRTPDGEISCLKKGVLTYTLMDNGELVYSNGRYVIGFDQASGEEHILLEEKLVQNFVAGQ
jgi:hypothetical protein